MVHSSVDHLIYREIRHCKWKYYFVLKASYITNLVKMFLVLVFLVSRLNNVSKIYSFTLLIFPIKASTFS